jgi:O-antigen/teichoic acid export membrane protein
LSQSDSISSKSPQSTLKSRVPLPEGAFSVGVGLFIAGISAFIFFKIGQQALGQDGFKPIVAMWFIAFSLAPGFFLPIEQEVGRALSHRRALHQGGRPVVQRILPLAIGMLVVLVAVIAATSPYVTKHLFDGYGIVVVCLILTLVSYAPMHLARGICSGSQRFGAYGIIIGADGAARVVGVAVLWALGIQSVGAFALMIAISPLVGVIGVGLAGKLHTDVGPPTPWSEVTPNLGWLLIGSLFAAALVNAGPITVDILGTNAKPELITQFGNAVIFARIPLFLFQAVQAALLPRLARLAAQGHLDEFRQALRKLLVFVVGVGVVGTAGAFAIGPPVLKLVYEGGIDRRTLTLLALSSAIYMVAVTFAQATIALQGHAIAGIGWALGFGSFVAIAAWSSSDLYLRVELALVGSSLVALVSFMVALRSRMLKQS